MRYTKLYDKAMNLVAILENANVSLDALKFNDLSIVSFTLPNSDPKNELCEDRMFIEVFDGNDSVGIFRIKGSPDSDEVNAGEVIKYEAEHAIATLLDDVFVGYTEYGGTGITTAQVLQFILNKQSVVRWQLGTCAFNAPLQHKWESDDLLTALFSVAKAFTDYQWTYNFNTSPWTVSLVAASTTPVCEVRYRKNLDTIKRRRDSSNVITKLFCYGYGEGVNQLTISSVNGGNPYLLADTYDASDPAVGVFVDTTIEDANLLKSIGQAALERLKSPQYTYTVSAIDLYRITGLEWDKFSAGKMLKIYDGKASFNARIIEVSKPDPQGDPGNIRLTIANNDSDVADTITNLANRAKITALYSQGATNLYAQQYSDNANTGHPAVMKFYVPRNCVRVNKVLVSWSFEKFRAYSTGAASGGASEKTSRSGGGATVTSAPNGSDNTGPATGNTGSPSEEYTGYSGVDVTGGAYAEYGLSHNHSVPNHRHSLSGHTHNLGAHTHSLNNHSHNVTISAHTHIVDIDAHTHDIVYGIYEGGKATTATIKVDGTTVPAGSVTSDEMNVVAWLAKDANGRITRGAWHTIEVIPNTLTRIEANLFVQAFIQSIGGGDY